MADASNPYAAPQAGVADTDGQRGRPALVWVIAVFVSLGVIATVGSAAAAVFGGSIGGDAFAAYMKQVSPRDHAAGLARTALTGWALVELVRLKRRALALFCAALGFGVAIFGLNMALRPDYRAMFEQAGYSKLILGWLVNLAIIGYIWRLHARGTLTR